jgi:hypothetical protein
VEGVDASSVAAVTLASACDTPALAMVSAGSLTAASTTASLALPAGLAAGTYQLRVAIVSGKGAGARSAVRAITVTAAPGFDQCAATTGPSESLTLQRLAAVPSAVGFRRLRISAPSSQSTFPLGAPPSPP